MPEPEHPVKQAAYQVLARKYRPQTFDDLIGHEAMVRTLRNAFASGRIAHAFILTGVRGVGKTTTARILARALNYVGPDGADNGPAIDMPAEGLHCRAIAESRHPDVMEMDAASRTGVGDIRELIEGVRYAPVQARYKVYIIDEVHMLSTSAFNALLKTLEEPPPHVKFVFATTEIRKVPVTVLSRCQRFDLRRIDRETLAAHLQTIADKEGATVAREGLALIARAAEGSVRDALSLLDQAIVQHTSAGGGDGLSVEAMRDMLGLADRTRVWETLEAALKGDARAALENFRAQYDAGADPAVVLRDLLEVVHLLTRVKAAGDAAAAHGPAGAAEAEQARTQAAALSMNALTRAWSLLMKGLTETQNAPDPVASVEMTLIRLAYAADLPTPDEALRMLKGAGAAGAAAAPSGTGGGARAQTSGGGAQAASASQASPAPQAAYAPQASPQATYAQKIETRARPAEASLPQPATFEAVVRLAHEHREARLKAELESYVHLVSFEPGRLELRLADGASGDLPNRLGQKLRQWTGAFWAVTVNARAQGAPTLKDSKFAEVMAHPLVQKALETFPGAEILTIRDVAPAPDASHTEGTGADDDAPEDAPESDD